MREGVAPAAAPFPIAKRSTGGHLWE